MGAHQGCYPRWRGSAGEEKHWLVSHRGAGRRCGTCGGGFRAGWWLEVAAHVEAPAEEATAQWMVFPGPLAVAPAARGGAPHGGNLVSSKAVAPETRVTVASMVASVRLEVQSGDDAMRKRGREAWVAFLRRRADKGNPWWRMWGGVGQRPVVTDCVGRHKVCADQVRMTWASGAVTGARGHDWCTVLVGPA
jgi:hypothetical protein